MNESEIVKLTDRILSKFLETRSLEEILDFGLNVDDRYNEIVYPETDALLIKGADLEDVDKKTVLGKTIIQEKPKEKLIFLNKIITEQFDSRYAFVLAHEIGHVYFSKSRKNNFIDGVVCNSEDEKIANCFAKHFVMPSEIVKIQYKRQYNRMLTYIGPGEYFFNNRKRTIKSLDHFCWEAARCLSPCFSHVSNQALGLRLYELNLIRNKTNEVFQADYRLYSNESKAIGNILKKEFAK